MEDLLKKIYSDFTSEEDGATAIEYAILASMVSVIIVVAVNSIGSSVNTLFFDKLIALF